MSNKDGGGAAFPSAGVVIDYDKNEHQQGAYEGMSLRDYFAAKAMQDMIANGDWVSRMASRTGAEPSECTSCAAYEVADAMIAERSKS